eukprot:NODE_153_length_16933_cov_0.442141.p1 type:complete len:419 gc:universal NODE_153_length_16933_cov_0.442141:6521-7777(+)
MILDEIVDIRPFCEMRFQAVDITITVLEGIAELFGTELANNTPYNLVSCNGALSTFHGCQLRIQGECNEKYMGSESYINLSYLNLAFSLHIQKSANVLILGSRYSGKTSLVKRLANYTTKRGMTPFIVDLDITSGLISLPATVSCMPLDLQIDPTCGSCLSFNVTSLNAETLPLVYYFGYTHLKQHEDLYYTLMQKVKDNMNKYSDKHSVPFTFIDMMPDPSVEMIKKVIEIFQINNIIIISDELLFSRIKDVVSCKIALVKKSEGVFTPGSTDSANKIAQQKIREYFYGAKKELSPFSTNCKTDDIVVVKRGQLFSGAAHTMPLHSNSEKNLTFIGAMEASFLDKGLIALSAAVNAEDSITEHVIGFGFVSTVDEAKATDEGVVPPARLQILLPEPMKLKESQRVFITGDMKWIQSK